MTLAAEVVLPKPSPHTAGSLKGGREGHLEEMNLIVGPG